MKPKQINFFIIILCLVVLACEKKVTTLPIMGPKSVEENIVDGKKVVDTLYHTIPDFNFLNQDSNKISGKTLEGKIYIADFFFTTCPTICPVMKKQLLRVYEKYADDDRIVLLSHTIDPVHDSVAVLRDYAQRLGVESSKWNFVTGEKDSIYKIAQSYLVSAMEDKDAPGGFIHSGALILVDESRRIRGYYDGTNEDKVTELIADIPLLFHDK